MNKNNKNRVIVSTISPQRFQPYLSKTGGDVNKAFELYEENVRLSAEFYQYLSFFEVGMRNKLNDSMIRDYGDMWLLNPKTPLQEKHRENIEKVCERLRRKGIIIGKTPESMGRIVADLSLGFWIKLLSSGLGQPLWRSTLRHAFPNYRGNFKPLRYRVSQIWELRNRIAHHEPIIFMDNIEGMREEILEVIGWMCEDTRDWAARF